MKTETPLTEQEIKAILKTAIENYSELTNLADGYDNDKAEFKQFVEQYHASQFKVELSDEDINKMAEEAYPKIGEWSGEEKDWIDGNYHSRIAYYKGFKSGLQHREDKAVGFGEFIAEHCVDHIMGEFSQELGKWKYHKPNGENLFVASTKELYELYLTKGK